MRLLSPTEQAFIDGIRDFTNAQKRYLRCRIRKKVESVNEQGCNVAARLQRSRDDYDYARARSVVRISRRDSLVNDDIMPISEEGRSGPAGIRTLGLRLSSPSPHTQKKRAKVPKTAAIS